MITAWSANKLFYQIITSLEQGDIEEARRLAAEGALKTELHLKSLDMVVGAKVRLLTPIIVGKEELIPAGTIGQVKATAPSWREVKFADSDRSHYLSLTELEIVR